MWVSDSSENDSIKDNIDYYLNLRISKKNDVPHPFWVFFIFWNELKNERIGDGTRRSHYLYGSNQFPSMHVNNIAKAYSVEKWVATSIPPQHMSPLKWSLVCMQLVLPSIGLVRK